MTVEDLWELLLSIAEEDAIISTLFSFFIRNKGYSTQILEDIIFYGVAIGWFEIVNVENDNIPYTDIEWKIDNDFQEVVFCDNDFAVKTLFTQEGGIPELFRKFILWQNAQSIPVLHLKSLTDLLGLTLNLRIIYK